MKYVSWSGGPKAVAGFALFAACVVLVSTAARASRIGHTARVLPVNDTARMTLTNPSSASATLIEEGRALGSLPGTVRARLTIATSAMTAGFTIYVHGGTISGHSAARLNPGRGEYASFSGSLSVSYGSGSYAHASGSGELYGTINRNTDNATVQVVGNLHL